MIRLRILILIVLVAAIVQGLQHRGTVQPNPVPTPEAKAAALFIYDVDSPPKLVGSRDLRDWMDQHSVAYRFAGPKDVFGDDQPNFKSLMQQPRQADSWLYIHGGRRKDDSVPMPADETSAEQLIGKHAR